MYNLYYALSFVAIAVIGYLIWLNKDRIRTMFRFKKRGTPILDLYSKDLTELARAGRLDPVIGRKKEIERVTQILSRRTKNNPILLGEPGVGKTAIVEGLAQRIAQKKIPESLRAKRVLALNVSALIAGTKYRGEFEQRLKKIMEEIRASQRQIILFIDEIHTLLEAKGAEGALDPGDILKPALARGDLQAIGATTLRDFEKYIKPDESLERRFQPVMVAPPTVQMTIEILKGIAPVYENHHKVKFTQDALVAATVLSERYIKERYLPDKAIDIVDEAAAKVRLRLIGVPDRIERLKKNIKKLEERKKFTTKKATLLEIEEKISKSKEKIKRLTTLYEEDIKGIKPPYVEVKDIKEIVSEWAQIPIEQIEDTLRY